MKSILKSVVANQTVQLLLCLLSYLGTGAMIIAALVALAIYVHPIAALIAACAFIAATGYFFDSKDF